MKRLFGCTVTMVYEEPAGFARISSFVADKHEFWWNERKPDEPSLWESKIELGEKFFNEIVRHPVPIDMNTLTALKRSPLGLDLYLWLVYRTFALRAPQRLTWRLLYSQFGAHPDKASDNNTVQAFRYKVLRELKKIKLAWPELNYTTAPGLLILPPKFILGFHRKHHLAVNPFFADQSRRFHPKPATERIHRTQRWCQDR